MQALELFTTPVTVFDLPGMDALNAELSERLLAEEQTSEGLQKSNYGGWHSAMDLCARPQACFRDLMRMLVDHVSRAVAERLGAGGQGPGPKLRQVHAWAMIMRAGDYTLMHDHAQADWAIAYYVDAGDDPRSGALSFADPRQGVRRSGAGSNLFPASVALQPRTGALVVFPGWLNHQVYAYEGRRPRISVSSNLVMEP